MRDLSDFIISNTHKNICHDDRLRSLTTNAAKTIEIVCPFISLEGIEWLKDNKKENVRITLITELSPRAVTSGVQSVEALSELIALGCDVRYLTSGLHAKMYWFDQNEVLLTSANMTRNGLSRNFELGFSLGPMILSENAFKGGTRAYKERLRSLWEFVFKQAEPLSLEILEKYKAVSNEVSDLRSQIIKIEDSWRDSLPEVPFTSFQRPSLNKQSISTDLMMTNIFEGFDLTHWDVFNNKLELTEENRNNFRKILDRQINPLLYKFYLQLKNDPIFKTNFSALERGFSQNLLLRNRFPHDRYLFLTKPRPGKAARRHLGEPSIIIGMGKGSSESGWLEVRSGVEEDTLSELSVAGERLIQNMLKNIDEVIVRLHSLGHGWYLSHGSFSKNTPKTVGVLDLDQKRLRSEISHYLTSREVSDIQIRRKYYLNDETDGAILLSPKITAVISKDVQNLSYFFDLANR
ncbi:MAG: phospholipase D family protein [Bdellovibrionaceae bacterium]|nr:phospholipase D family protein [Pseudobdellovibrionaceae bacterium]MBX3034927.1 phospholipase D family protein [Pseudobdellovibrionaceae bacterium]